MRVPEEQEPYDPEAVRPATRQETMPIAMMAVFLGMIALMFCYSRGYLLLYGDAVAHLGIARRIFDSRNPGLAQLGGVWLPLPHLLMLPFVQRMDWWQNGLAGAWPSLLAYVVGVAGFYRLCRRLLIPRWAFAATAFYALNPNLLYLSATAMNEPLFLALVVWLTLLTIEVLDRMRGETVTDKKVVGKTVIAKPRQPVVGLVALAVLIFAAVFTRYDGWIFGASIWLVFAVQTLRRGQPSRRWTVAFAIFTLIAIAGPVLWLVYNHHFMGDALDFMRGPYSAAAIERKTSVPGAPHYRGWHNLGWALVFYTRTAQVDAAAWETGFVLLAAALGGVSLMLRRGFAGARRAALLLWIPLPFYLYSVAYGSVPIFIPQLYPHSFYNARYGMEMLPALALFTFLLLAEMERSVAATQPKIARTLAPLALALCVANAVAMGYFTPLVLKEGIVNARTRVPFEDSIARQIQSFPAGAPILMYNSDHIGAIERAGIPLRQTINEGDRDSFEKALADPADSALYIIAIAGDPVSNAVAAHPENLTELSVLCTTGQPCARVYHSDRYGIAHAPQQP
jgi:hypothetical protein